MTDRPNTSKRFSTLVTSLVFALAFASISGPALTGPPPLFTEAQGYEPIDHERVLRNLIDTLPQISSNFPAGGALNPLTKAVLFLENEEGVVAHARYRIRYGLEGRTGMPGGKAVPFSFVQVDRFNLGKVFRSGVMQSVDEASTAPAEVLGAGAHVSYRFVLRPVQGRTADPVTIGRQVIADGVAGVMRCLPLPCLDRASVGEGAALWHDYAGSGTSFDRSYEDIRDGVYTPAAMADVLALEVGVARIDDGRLRWIGFEEPESLRDGQPFMEMVMDVNLAQDFGIEAVLRLGHLMDDSVAVIWKRVRTIPSGSQAPHLSLSRAFECARGEPNHEGLCP